MAANNNEELFYDYQSTNGGGSPAMPISGRNQSNPFLFSDPEAISYLNDQPDLYNYRINPTLPESLYHDFSRLTLSTAPHRPRFSDPASHGGAVTGGGVPFLGNNSPVLDSPADIRAANRYLQRMRVESAIKGQIQRQLLYLEGMNNSFDYFDHNNNLVTNRGRSLSNTMNGFQSSNNLGSLDIRANRNGFPSSNELVCPNNGNNVHRRDKMRFDIDPLDLSLRNNMMLRTSNNNTNIQYGRVPRQQLQIPRYTSVEELRGRIYRLAKDQTGCRFLGEKFDGDLKAEEVEMIFVEVKDHVRELMVDQFGNFLVQKLFDVCNEDQMNQILRSVVSDSRNLLAICLDMHGTRAMQKLLENLKTSHQKSSVVSVLKHITLTLTKSVNGHHVIQHSLKLFSNEDHIMQILDVVAENCMEIATDKSGCCVLQHCVGHAEGALQRRLVDQITTNALILSEHAYGNYVVQFILGLRLPQYTSDIIGQLTGSFVSLSMNKYGSNVVEKCLRESSEHQSSQIINELIQSKDFLMVLQDPFGNYVAQSALSLAKDKQKILLINAVQEHYAFIHSHPHGKRVLSRIKGFSKHHA